MSDQRYVLVQDRDHFYVCPVDRVSEARDYIESCGDYRHDRTAPAQPEWLVSVGRDRDLKDLTFADYTIGP